jgi:thioredoxin-related protein
MTNITNKGLRLLGFRSINHVPVSISTPSAKKVPCPQHYEDNAWEGELMKRFRVRYVPRLFLLDRTGRIAHQDTRQHLEEKVRELLAKLQ